MKGRAPILALALALASASSAGAASFSTDVSDLWYASPAESESGWGVNVAQQGDTLFLTMFVYGSNAQPTWFVGSNTVYAGTSGSSMVFRGPLYSTTGTPHSSPWNPSALNMKQVGNVSFTLTSPTTATLTYSADGVQVTKSLVRQTWKYNDTSGQYIGAVAGTFSKCANTARNGYAEEYSTVAIVHGGSSFSMDLENFEGLGTCSYRGTYSQAGRLGSAAGTWSCSGNMSGNFTATEIDASTSGITMLMNETGTCNWSGRIGGVRVP